MFVKDENSHCDQSGVLNLTRKCQLGLGDKRPKFKVWCKVKAHEPSMDGFMVTSIAIRNVIFSGLFAPYKPLKLEKRPQIYLYQSMSNSAFLEGKESLYG